MDFDPLKHQKLKMRIFDQFGGPYLDQQKNIISKSIYEQVFEVR